MVIRLPKRRLLTIEADRLLIEVHNPTFPNRSPDDAASVRRPDRIDVSRRIEGEARRVAPRYVIQPEIGGEGLRIAAISDKTLFVRGEPMLVITCDYVQRVD